MTEYQKREKELTEKLTQLLSPFVDSVSVEEDEHNENVFVGFVFRNGKKYQTRKDYQGNISFWFDFWDKWPNVSSYVKGKVSKKHASNNMKVPSQKKIGAMLDALDAHALELDSLQAEAVEKEADFIESLKSEAVQWGQDRKSGYVVKNGLEFSFEIGQDGYISKKITVHYSVDNTLEAFRSLSDNSFKA